MKPSKSQRIRGDWGNNQGTIGSKAYANKLDVLKILFCLAIQGYIGFVYGDEARIFGKINPFDFHNKMISTISNLFKIFQFSCDYKVICF